MVMKVCWATLGAVAFLSLAPPAVGSRAFGAAAASAQAEAEAHVKKGLELRRKSRDTEALAEFQEAMRLSPSARAKAQVGLAQMAVGLFEAAEATLLDVLSSSANEPWVSAHKAALTDALTKIRNHLGTLSASGAPQGATVEVNGTAIGSLPCSVHVQAGDVVVRVLAPGFIPIMRTVSVEPHQTAGQVFTLVRVPGDKALDKVPADRTPERDLAEKAPRDEPLTEAKPKPPPPEDASSDDSHSLPWRWIAGGGSLLALSFGALEAVRWASKAAEFNNMKGADGSPLCSEVTATAGGASCSKVLSEGHTARAFTIGGFAVGAALGVTSAILFARESPGDARQALSCAPVVGTPAVVCYGRF